MSGAAAAASAAPAAAGGASEEMRLRVAKSVNQCMQRVAAAMTKSANRVFDFSKHGKCKIALRVAYAGWDLHGFAWQKDAPTTVEQALFEALLKTRCAISRFILRSSDSVSNARVTQPQAHRGQGHVRLHALRAH
jgi:hypothetical protein